MRFAGPPVPSAGCVPRRSPRVPAVAPREDQRQEQQRVVGAPGDECPVRAVPEPADEEDDQRVAEHHPFRTPAAAQRDVDVVAEPRGERDVPAAPEFGDVAREIGVVEIAHEAEPEQPRDADGDVRVAREIAVDLEREGHGADDEGSSRKVFVVVEDAVGEDGAVVRHDDLLEESPQRLPQSVYGLRRVERPRPQELRQQVRGPFDGAGHQLREEGDEGEESDDVACRGELFAVNVDRVAQGLERVERDADRQDDPQQETVVVGDAEQFGERCREEVVILEDAEDREVQQDVSRVDGPAPSFPPPSVSGSGR